MQELLSRASLYGVSPDDTSWRSIQLLFFLRQPSNEGAFEGVVCAITGDELTIPDDYVVVEADYSLSTKIMRMANLLASQIFFCYRGRIR